MKYLWLLIIVLFALLLLSTCDNIRLRHKSNEKDIDYTAVQDTLHQTRNKLGQQETVTLSLQSDVKTAKEALKYVRDSAGVRLRENINNRTQAAISANTETHSKGSNKTTVKNGDTVYKHDTVLIYPTYTTSFNNRWESGFITANKDSIAHDIKIRNEFDFKIEEGKWHFFKKQDETTVTMRNLNPFTETRELKSFVVAPKPSYRGYYFLGGVIVAIVTQNLIRY